jgi:hypothetical protein
MSAAPIISRYLVYSIGAFVADWMPAPGARSELNYAARVIPVATFGCAPAGFASSARLWARRESHPLPLHGLVNHATMRHSLP